MKAKLLLLFLFSVHCYSQSLEGLKTETKKIYDANYTMDFDMIYDLSYPKIKEGTDKETMIAKLDSDFQNDEFRMRLELENPVFLYSDIKKMEGKSFCIISYKNPVRYFFEKKLDAETAAKKIAAFKEYNNTKEVFLEPKRNSINVKRSSKLIAIADVTTNNEWKFFNLDNEIQRALFQSLFGESLKIN